MAPGGAGGAPDAAVTITGKSLLVVVGSQDYILCVELDRSGLRHNHRTGQDQDQEDPGGSGSRQDGGAKAHSGTKTRCHSLLQHSDEL